MCQIILVSYPIDNESRKHSSKTLLPTRNSRTTLVGAGTLERNINTLYYQRLLASQRKDIVAEEMQQTAAFQQDPYEFIKNPTVLEFLNIPTHYAYNENDLEKT